MQIQILKTRGLGKFCSSRTSGIRVGEMDQIFGKAPSGEIWLIFFGPAGGSRTRKGAFALQDNIIWLVEKEIAFFVEQQYFSRTTSGANCAESGLRFFEKYFHKNGHISSSCGQILLRSFQSGAFCMQIQILKTRGLGKSVARERALYVLAKWTKFLEKCPLVPYILIFQGLPGAHASGRVHSPFKTISYGE